MAALFYFCRNSSGSLADVSRDPLRLVAREHLGS